MNESDLRTILEAIPMPPDARRRIIASCLGARRARLHHYVPQAYQRGWVNDGTVMVWDTLDGRIFRASPKRMCAGADYFKAVTGSGGHRMVEGLLSYFDGEYARLIASIRQTGLLPRDHDARVILGYTIALQLMRVAQRRRVYNDMSDYLAKLVASPDLRKAGLDPNDFRVQAHNNSHILIMGDVASMMLTDWVARDWTLYTADHPVFVTSDNPVMHSDYNKGESPGLATTPSVFFPVSPTQLLVLGSDRNYALHEEPATSAIIGRAERRVIRTRDRWIIGHPDQAFFNRRQAQTISRRAQLKLECAVHYFDNRGRRTSCLMRNSLTYAKGPVLRTCDYWKDSPVRIRFEHAPLEEVRLASPHQNANG